MANYVFHIPSRTHPKEFTKIQESVFCFSSKESYSASDYFKFTLCVIVIAETEEEVMKKLKDFLITLNVFHYESDSILWFSSITVKSKIIEKSVEEIHKDYNTLDIPSGFYCDFNDMPMHLTSAKMPSFSFIEVYHKISDLDEKEFLYKALSFLALIHPIKMLSLRIFDNALFENTLQFQLFESIMLKYDTTKERKEICDECKRPKRRSVKQRIEDFFNLDDYTNINDKQEFIDSALIISKTRNKFSHALAGKSIMQYYYENIEPNLGAGTTIYLKEDIEHAEGTMNAIFNMKTLNTLILLDKLLAN